MYVLCYDYDYYFQSLTGAQIVGILNHATISAVTDGRNKINSHDIYSATEKASIISGYSKIVI